MRRALFQKMLAIHNLEQLDERLSEQEYMAQKDRVK